MNKETIAAFVAGLVVMAVIGAAYLGYQGDSGRATVAAQTNPAPEAPDSKAGDTAESAVMITDTNGLIANVETKTPPTDSTKAEKPKRETEESAGIGGEPMHGDYPDPATDLESAECWGDYCPCDTSDPDYGYFDISLCRKVRMGRPISDGEYDIGAMGRDARKALREDQEKNGPYQ